MMWKASVVAGLLCLAAQSVHAAISLDRTRVVFPGGQKSVTLGISNQNTTHPYLAQGWIEDEDGNKLTSPLVVVPPIQRVEPGAKSQVKLQDGGLASLPQDRESVFYFNLREIPPKSDKVNTLQIALQTRIKAFYRPAALAEAASGQQTAPFQEQLTLSRQGDVYTVNNPTAYYVTLISATSKKGGESNKGFEAFMLAPKSSAPLGGSAAGLGATPTLVYVNDYGAQPVLTFSCTGQTCAVDVPATQRNAAQ
ncbi:fimbria/pilus periplasmic chaperone [Pseudomonas fontis]|uniref:Fimbria/pilus periplasmic chaperone n=1 Tax=Pseudomonas fontis TaxID=2942633 RepID=A0ABT5NQ46_9PSED|nr:fimbria/pilus periplasmic chaperone [Pseudomonas fontis]MDD0972845.1 fimbria/pilus periplasmic chaperone [Pseudomonas fontis]MDD0990302.1 fimbria/pilus periplasmic chaperone [Pseudomonas fontis]